MRTLCPNLDREDGLDTVLEVPIPEEADKHKSWSNLRTWITTRPHSSVFGGRAAEIQFLLGVTGAPLIPLPISSSSCHSTLKDNIRDDYPIESSMAKYIVQQYVAAAGGEHALNCIESMCAVGKVKMAASEFVSGEESSKVMMKNMKHGRGGGGGGEIGGFVLWQKCPDLWSLELMVSGHKMSAGSDGKVAWRETPWQHSHASRGPPRPLRRSLQGLDPRSTANLFSNSSICIGEKAIDDEDCFVLKLEAEASTLRARSSNDVEILRHTVWGSFSQKTGLLLQLQDTHLLKIKAPGNDVLWETTIESLIQDYRTVDGVNIAHSGRTSVSLFRFGENAESHTRTRMEEIWSIEEVDFNIKGLSNDCFLPPADLIREDEHITTKNGGPFPYKILGNSSRNNVGAKSATKVVAIEQQNLDMYFHNGEEM